MVRHEDQVAVNTSRYSSLKSRRVCKSELTAERFAFFDGVDIGSTTAHDLWKLLWGNNILIMYTKSCLLYGIHVPVLQTVVLPHQLTLSVIREMQKSRGITCIFWWKPKSSPAEGSSKLYRQAKMLFNDIESSLFVRKDDICEQRDE